KSERGGAICPPFPNPYGLAAELPATGSVTIGAAFRPPSGLIPKRLSNWPLIGSFNPRRGILRRSQPLSKSRCPGVLLLSRTGCTLEVLGPNSGSPKPGGRIDFLPKGSPI